MRAELQIPPSPNQDLTTPNGGKEIKKYRDIYSNI